jgi:hypothetical protein
VDSFVVHKTKGGSLKAGEKRCLNQAGIVVFKLGCIFIIYLVQVRDKQLSAIQLNQGAAAAYITCSRRPSLGGAFQLLVLVGLSA